MTLDKAIYFYTHPEIIQRERIEEERNNEEPIFCGKEIAEFIKTGDKYKQLAEWLIELKEFKENSKWHKIKEELPKESGKLPGKWGNIGNLFGQGIIDNYEDDFPFDEYINRYDSNTLGYID